MTVTSFGRPVRPAEDDLALVWPWVQYRTFLWLQRDDDDMSAQLGVANQIFGSIFGGQYVIPPMPDDTVMQAVRPWLVDQAVRFGRAFKLCEDFEEALDAIVGAEFRVKGKWRDSGGVSISGHNLDGYDRDGYDENEQDAEGRDKNGYDGEGYGRDGFNRWSHRNKEGLTREGAAKAKAIEHLAVTTKQLIESWDDEQCRAFMAGLIDRGIQSGPVAK